MGSALTERRRAPRVAGARVGIAAATLRPGCLVEIVDLGPAGAQVQSDRPLRPGTRVQMRIKAGSGIIAITARVLRCVVWALHPERGVTYRGALEFDEPCAAMLHPSLHSFELSAG